jgi:hypothetical protein
MFSMAVPAFYNCDDPFIRSLLLSAPAISFIRTSKIHSQLISKAVDALQ